LIFSGCALKLFEIQEDKLNMDSELEETKKDRKIKNEDKDKIADLKEILEKRSKPKIGRKKDEKSNLLRYIREDIQDKIDDEWKKGWDYLQRLEIPIYQDETGSNGILVHINNLPVYERGDNIINSSSSKPQIKLSFLHLSDVQLRDERVYMFRKELTDFLDLFTDGFSHDPNLVGYDHSYYLNLVGVMKLLKNKLGEEQPVPSFMIHTGDVAHMGVVSEHYEFLYITNELTIPWYNVLGNHDYPVYGNLSSKDVGVIDPNMGFQTLSCRYNFINMHGMGFEIDPNVYFSPINAPHDPTWDAKKSVYNGFDMKGAKSVVAGNKEKPCKECPGGKPCKECPDGKPCKECPDGKYCGKCSDRKPCVECSDGKPCQECPGYYHFEALQPKGGEPGILAVVLDTSVEDFHFSQGSVCSVCRKKYEKESKDQDICDREQIEWLKDVLEEYAKKGNWMVLTFGHHALKSKSFCDESYKEVTDLFQNPRYNVIAYFCGHTHEHWVEYHRKEGHPESWGFWEITTGSIMEYPKKGGLVSIVYGAENRWAITLQSFWPYFLNNIDIDDPAIPAMLKNAKRCFEASKIDDEGSKKKYYEELGAEHHDAVLPFSFPKSGNK